MQERQHPVDVSAGLQEVDPGQHSHHVANPERRDQQDQEETFATASKPRHEVGGWIRDEQGQDRPNRYIGDRPNPHRPDKTPNPPQLMPLTPAPTPTPPPRAP